MQLFRHILAQRRLAALICVAAVVFKLLVPTGYMVERDRGHLALTICSGMMTEPGAAAMAGMHGDMAGHGKSKDAGKAEGTCTFAGLSAVALDAADPVQLAVLLAFVMAVGLAAALPPTPTRPVRLRPPLRGPPGHL